MVKGDVSVSEASTGGRIDAPRILVVEDEVLLQDSLRMILSSQGYGVEIAGDGLVAIDKLKSFHPDLILLDYFMPRMDGRNFLENVDLTQYPAMKVVVTSNISDQAVVKELLGLGAHRYVLKASLSPTELLKLVDDTIGDGAASAATSR